MIINIIWVPIFHVQSCKIHIYFQNSNTLDLSPDTSFQKSDGVKKSVYDFMTLNYIQNTCTCITKCTM